MEMAFEEGVRLLFAVIIDMYASGALVNIKINKTLDIKILQRFFIGSNPGQKPTLTNIHQD